MRAAFRTAIFFLGLLVFKSTAAFAQDEKRFTVAFTGTPFPQFVEQVEQGSGYHFYYDPNLLDSFKVTVSVKDATLAALLQQVFQNSMFHFAIDKQQVIITKQVAIQASLPEDFFDRNKLRTDTAAIAVTEDLKTKSK